MRESDYLVNVRIQPSSEDISQLQVERGIDGRNKTCREGEGEIERGKD